MLLSSFYIGDLRVIAGFTPVFLHLLYICMYFVLQSVNVDWPPALETQQENAVNGTESINN